MCLAVKASPPGEFKFIFSQKRVPPVDCKISNDSKANPPYPQICGRSKFSLNLLPISVHYHPHQDQLNMAQTCLKQTHLSTCLMTPLTPSQARPENCRKKEKLANRLR